MNTLKKNIIYHYIVITFVLLVSEIYLFRLLSDNALFLESATGIPEIVFQCVGVLIALALFSVFSYYYYRKISAFIAEDTDRRIRERNLLFANIAHDLKNPIASVLGLARALEEGAVSEEELQSVYSTISGKSLQVDDMIQKLFRYAKMTSEGYAISCSEVDLCRIVRECTALRYNEIESRSMEIELDIPDEPVIRQADALELSRLTDNLIANAVRHNEAGTGLLIALRTENGKTRLMVADKGQDIPPSMRDAIFEPFQCSDESRTAKDGSGLGLAIARRIAELHGGRLYIDSSIPNYTKAFVLEL